MDEAKIWLNDREREIAEGITVTELLENEDIDPGVVSVKLNDRILDREEFDRVEVADGDRFEFVFFMGGGQRRV